ncbi:hypothetical protein [Halosimplex sp. J119]
MPRGKPSRQYQPSNRRMNEDHKLVFVEDSTFVIGEFFEENSKLFTLLSIFGAFIVYLSNLEVNSQPRVLRLGIAASVLLFLLTFWALVKRLGQSVGGPAGFLERVLNRTDGSYELLLFVVPFTALAVSFLAISLEVRPAIGYLLQIVSFAIGGAIASGLVDWIDGKISENKPSILEDGILPYWRFQIFRILPLAIICGILVRIWQVNDTGVFVFTETEITQSVAASVRLGALVWLAILLLADVIVIFEDHRDSIIALLKSIDWKTIIYSTN